MFLFCPLFFSLCCSIFFHELCNISQCACMWQILNINGHYHAIWQPLKVKLVLVIMFVSCPAYSLFCSPLSQQSHWLGNQYDPPERKCKTEVLLCLCPYLCRPGSRWLWQGNIILSSANIILSSGYEGWLMPQRDKKWEGADHHFISHHKLLQSYTGLNKRFYFTHT